MIPDVPSGLYLADGLVIIQQIQARQAFAVRFVPVFFCQSGWLPIDPNLHLNCSQRRILPNLSTSTEGIFCRISVAEPPAEAMF